MISQKTINDIVSKIARFNRPEKIFLFGSYARGEMDENSDLDLLIVEETDLPAHKRATEIRKQLIHSKIPIDIIVYTPEEIEERKNVQSTLVNEVIRNGKLVYAR
ncbi:MAG: nucleotidyltransferase domain-containing protein [Candidatus Neomarinimicrobiota bacterium]